MDINRAKENLKGYLNWLKTNGFSMAKNDEAIQIILSELDKKENTINLMAEQLTTPVHSKKWVIDYFTNKVEESDK